MITAWWEQTTFVYLVFRTPWQNNETISWSLSDGNHISYSIPPLPYLSARPQEQGRQSASLLQLELLRPRATAAAIHRVIRCFGETILEKNISEFFTSQSIRIDAITFSKFHIEIRNANDIFHQAIWGFASTQRPKSNVVYSRSNHLD